MINLKYEDFKKLTPPQQQIYTQSLAFDHKAELRKDKCFLKTDQTADDFEDYCYQSGSTHSVMIWGDSHAASFYAGLKNEVNEIIQITAGGCAPLLDYNLKHRPNCSGVNQFALEVIATQKPDKLYMHANWTLVDNWITKDESTIMEKLSYTIQQVKNQSPETRILLIGGVPTWKMDLLDILLNRVKVDGKITEGLMFLEISNAVLKGKRKVDGQLHKAAEDNDVEFISLLNLVCEKNKCPVMNKAGGNVELFYFDSNHVTDVGASYFLKKLMAPAH